MSSLPKASEGEETQCVGFSPGKTQLSGQDSQEGDQYQWLVRRYHQAMRLGFPPCGTVLGALQSPPLHCLSFQEIRLPPTCSFLLYKMEMPPMSVCFPGCYKKSPWTQWQNSKWIWPELNASLGRHSPEMLYWKKSLFFPFLESTRGPYFTAPSIVTDSRTSSLNLSLFLSNIITLAPVKVGGFCNSPLLTFIIQDNLPLEKL